MTDYTEDKYTANKSNCKQVANYLKYNWFKMTLEQMGLDLSECFPDNSDEPEDQTIEQKNKLRHLLKQNSIIVADSLDDEIEIKIEGEVIAIWAKPLFKLKEDLSQQNREDRLYVEVNVKYWSVFDELTQGETNG